MNPRADPLLRHSIAGIAPGAAASLCDPPTPILLSRPALARLVAETIVSGVPASTFASWHILLRKPEGHVPPAAFLVRDRRRVMAASDRVAQAPSACGVIAFPGTVLGLVTEFDALRPNSSVTTVVEGTR